MKKFVLILCLFLQSMAMAVEKINIQMEEVKSDVEKNWYATAEMRYGEFDYDSDDDGKVSSVSLKPRIEYIKNNHQFRLQAPFTWFKSPGFDGEGDNSTRIFGRPEFTWEHISSINSDTGATVGAGFKLPIFSATDTDDFLIEMSRTTQVKVLGSLFQKRNSMNFYLKGSLEKDFDTKTSEGPVTTTVDKGIIFRSKIGLENETDQWTLGAAMNLAYGLTAFKTTREGTFFGTTVSETDKSGATKHTSIEFTGAYKMNPQSQLYFGIARTMTVDLEGGATFITHYDDFSQLAKTAIFGGYSQSF